MCGHLREYVCATETWLHFSSASRYALRTKLILKTALENSLQKQQLKHSRAVLHFVLRAYQEVLRKLQKSLCGTYIFPQMSTFQKTEIIDNSKHTLQKILILYSNSWCIHVYSGEEKGTSRSIKIPTKSPFCVLVVSSHSHPPAFCEADTRTIIPTPKE